VKLKTKLADYTLRFDGVIEIHPDLVSKFLLLGVSPSKLRVESLTDEINLFNDQVLDEDQISIIKKEPIPLKMDWRLPPEFVNLDIDEYIGEAFEAKLPELNYNEEEIEQAIERIHLELVEIKVRGMVEFIKTIIYILHELKKNNVVWGVGRGSSCASYVLFILGLHVVDCIKMDVDLVEFYHD
jgi:hypothetical protein